MEFETIKIGDNEVIKKLSFDITTYPDFNIKQLCLCEGEEMGCKEVELYIKTFVNVKRKELFKLLGVIGDRDAISHLEDDVPMKVTFEINADKMVEKVKEIRKDID